MYMFYILYFQIFNSKIVKLIRLDSKLSFQDFFKFSDKFRSWCNRKKLSNFTHSRDWKKAINCVVKRYMDDTPRKTLFEDVRLQMDAKLWGEEYDKHHPPKKVLESDINT